MAQKGSNASEVLLRAKEMDEEIFLTTLSREQLEKSGFDTSVFGSFEFVNVYVLWDGEFVLKYIFDADPSQFYYEKESEIGDLLDVVKKYISIGGE